MANTIVLKRSATPAKVPTTGQLALGEIAINTYDGLIYIKKDNGTASVVQIGGVTSVNGETGSVTIDTGDVAENGNLYFTNARARSAVSAGSGISYNSGTGAISTTQTLTTAGSPTFAGLTLTGGMGITGHILPAANITYDLGSASYQWRDIYVGPGSLYVNGSKVLEDVSGTITFSADTDENIRIKTVGAGILQLGSSAQTGVIQVDSTLQITGGKQITDSAGIEVNFGDDIDMNGNKVVGLGAPSANGDAATKLYVDTAISAVSTTSIAQGNSNISVVDSGTGTVTVTVDGSTALTVDATGVVVAGNFTVSGTTTTVNSNAISLADNIITLNSDATGAPSQNAGIEVERGDETNVQIRWNEGSDTWTFTNDGAVYNPLAVNTDGLAEGSTNQYFTNTRARGALSGSSGTGLSYNSGTGTFSLGSIPNSSLSNTSVTIGSTSTALGATSTTLAGLTSVTSTGFTGALTGNVTGNVTGSSGSTTGNAATVTNGVYTTDTGTVTSTMIANDTIVNADINSAAAIVDTKLATIATAGKVSNSATTAASANTASAIVARDASGNFTAGTITAALTGNVTGALTGNASTATSAAAWTTARTITLAGDLSGSVSIDGSTNVTLTATVAGDTVALGTDTTGNYVAAGAVSGSGLSGSASSEGSTFTVTSNATSANTPSTIVFRDASGNFTAGTITAALTGNTAGTHTGAVVGNASTATTLATARAIQGVNFDGSAAITVVTAGTGISVSGTAVTNTLSTSGGNIGGAIAVSGAITATGEVTAYFSDLRLKTNIVPIADALAKVEAINGVTFDPNAAALALGIDARHQMGVIAQEVEAVAPELVCDSAFAGYKTVRYDKLTALLIEAVKELSAKVTTLEAQLGNTKPTL
jgi:hypothetical protein